jgi:hypothetical protein
VVRQPTFLKKVVAISVNVLYNTFMSKTCLHCGTETTNPKFCNHSCSASYTNKNRAAVNTCKNCNSSIPKRNIYCNNSCQQEYQRKLKIQDFLDGKYIGQPLQFKSSSWIKTFLLENSNYKCSSCGIGEEWNGKPLTLEIDHVDGKAYNNTLENLRIICPNCHSQTDTYKSKNKTSDRTYRT